MALAICFCASSHATEFRLPDVWHERVTTESCPTLAGIYSSIGEEFTASCTNGNCAELKLKGNPMLRFVEHHPRYRADPGAVEETIEIPAFLQGQTRFAIRQPSAETFEVLVPFAKGNLGAKRTFDSSKSDFSCRAGRIQLPRMHMQSISEQGDYRAGFVEIEIARMKDGAIAYFVHEKSTIRVLFGLLGESNESITAIRYLPVTQ